MYLIGGYGDIAEPSRLRKVDIRSRLTETHVH